MKVKAWIDSADWTVDIPDEEFEEDMTPLEKERVIEDYVCFEVEQHLSWGYDK